MPPTSALPWRVAHLQPPNPAQWMACHHGFRSWSSSMPTLTDPVVFAIGPIEVRWYALFIVLGIVLAVGLATWLANQRGLDGELLLDISPIVVLSAIVGARLYYVTL